MKFVLKKLTYEFVWGEWKLVSTYSHTLTSEIFRLTLRPLSADGKHTDQKNG
jgi:hypothetical protein